MRVQGRRHRPTEEHAGAFRPAQGANGKEGEAARTQEWKNAQAHNHLVKTWVQKFQRERRHAARPWNAISYVDWGAVMGPRSFPDDRRIAGDIPHHFGLEARLAFDQMLVNHLVELERQDALDLAPTSWVMDNVGDAADDCSRAGFPPYYCLGREEIDSSYARFLTKTAATNPNESEPDRVERARADFCDDCLWAGNITCGHRLTYMRGHHGTPELRALESLMQSQRACNESSSAPFQTRK